MLEHLLDAVSIAYTWSNLAWLTLGVVVGVVVGAIPGLGAQMAIAIALPLTFYIAPTAALGLLMGIYKGSMFGGSVSAILLATPGTPQAAATVLDGHVLAKQGKAGKALDMALYASVLGDASSDILTILLVIPIAMLALRIGPIELTSIVFLALTLVAVLSGRSVIKGLIAALIGAFLGLIGPDPILGRARFNFGLLELQSSISLTAFMMGLFAVSEIIQNALAARSARGIQEMTGDPAGSRLTWAELKESLPTILRGTGLGTAIAILPGLGSTVAAFLSYAVAQRRSRKPHLFGKGALEGVAAAESANSATAGPTLVPLFALGVPGSAIAALFGSALLMQGITPGPLLMQTHPHVIYPFFLLMLLGNLVNLLVGRIFIRWAPAVLRLPARWLFPAVFALCVVGVYASDGSLFSVAVMIAAGVLGYVLQLGGYPVGPVILAFILSPMLEQSLRQSLLLSGGDFTVFVTRPIPLTMLAISIALLWFLFKGWRQPQMPASEPEPERG